MLEEKQVHAGQVRGMIDGIEEVAGVKGRNLVLHHANLEQYIENPPPMSEKDFVPRDHYRAVERALMEVFGTKGSRVLLTYSGEATVRRGIEGLPGLFSTAMKVMPGGLKKKAALRVAINQSARISGIAPKAHFQKDRVIYSNPGCTACEGHHSDEPVCFYTSGALKFLAEWATGKKHQVAEVNCRAMGHEACVYEITEA